MYPTPGMSSRSLQGFDLDRKMDRTYQGLTPGPIHSHLYSLVMDGVGKWVSRLKRNEKKVLLYNTSPKRP